LDEVERQFDPAWASIVVIDPRDGRILSSHATPSFDPNRYESFFDPGRDVYSDPAVTATFTPGSVMKPFVLAAALQEGVVGIDELIDCEGGRWLPAGRSQAITDVHAFDLIPVREVVVESSNIGAAKIGLRLGPDLMRGWLSRFELGSRTGIGGPVEVRSQVPAAERWRGAEGTAWTVPSVSFGYQVALTPMRLAVSFAPLVNGGWSVDPRLIESVESDAGAPRDLDRRRILDPEAARAVREALVEVCQRGTASRVVPEGMTMGGKTGTAVRLGRSDGGYTATFVGFAPADAPRYLCVAVVDRPQGGRHFGSQVAAPAVAAVLEAAMALEAQ
jgi:cell division protein FtsI (penicillin-binding protein 3)